MIPVGVGIEEDGVPLALQTANPRDLARKSLELAPGVATGGLFKRITGIEDEVDDGVARPRKAPAIPFLVF